MPSNAHVAGISVPITFDAPCGTPSKPEKRIWGIRISGTKLVAISEVLTIAEPKRHEPEHKIRKVARTLRANYEIGKKRDDGRLSKQNQQIEFVAAEYFQIASRERAPLPHDVNGGGPSLWRGERAAIARQNAQWFHHVAAIRIRILEFSLPIVGNLLCNLLALLFEVSLLCFARVRRRRRDGRNLLIDGRLEFIEKVFEAFGFHMRQRLLRCAVKD